MICLFINLFLIPNSAQAKNAFVNWDLQKLSVNRFARQMALAIFTEKELRSSPPSNCDKERLQLIQLMICSRVQVDQEVWAKVMSSLRSYHHELNPKADQAD